ncbi:unnamed protein product, partial [Prorocentrum cordatum]
GWLSTSILGEPQENFIQEVSDHSLLMTELASLRPIPRDAGHLALIAPAVRKHAKFKEYLQAYVNAFPLQDTAAKDIQKFLLCNHGRSQECLAMIFRQRGRSVNRNWRRLATTLMANHPWTRDFISIAEGQVRIVDHADFQMEFDFAQQWAGARRRRALERPEATETNADLRKRLQGQKRAHRRRTKLWAPTGSRKYTIGIAKEDGEVTVTLEETNVGPACF